MKMQVRHLVFLLVFLSPTLLLAHIAPWTQGMIATPVNGTPVPAGATATAFAPRPSGVTYLDRSRRGVITFGVDHHYEKAVAAGTTKIDIIVHRWSNGSASPSSTPDLPDVPYTLEVQYDPQGQLSFVDKQIIEVSDAELYTVVIDKIWINGAYNASNVLPANLYVQADVYVDRLIDYSSQIGNAPTGVTSTPVDLDGDGLYDELQISWSPKTGTEEYQLEWTFVNDYSDVAGSYRLNTDVHYDFKTNSTRISSGLNSYSITLAFDHGYLCYRVRGVGRGGPGLAKRIYTPWTVALDAGKVSQIPTANYPTDPFELEKNWQYSTTYAEEGKKKEVVSFFDGTLRNRQMVTKINSDNNTIVGETIYDHQGRPAIQVLPVPVETEPGTETSIKYYKDFSLNDQNETYNRSDFDLDYDGQCAVQAGAMNATAGASHYYSPPNTPLVDAEQGFVPDAELYPFSQVEYTPDNTGRIRRQGGVGPEFQLGSDHESKFYYGHPSQIQLDRLFGSEVGDYCHYQKNMVVDPNGQVSVSYLDQEGRVIATSLAAAAPSNLKALPSEIAAGTSGVVLSDDVLGGSCSNSTNADGNTLESNSTMLVSYQTDVTFDYDLNSAPFEDECLLDGICFSCVYDLEIVVRNECGIELTDSTRHRIKAGRFVVTETSEIEFLTTCTDGTDIVPEPFTLNLPMGNYQITKRLTVNEGAINHYLTEYLDQDNTKANCIKTLEDFQQEYLAMADTTGCEHTENDCADCLARLEEAKANDQLSDEEYNAMKEVCDLKCRENSFCGTVTEQMMADLSPGGQYGEYQLTDGSIDPTSFPLSVYNAATLLPQTFANPAVDVMWRKPQRGEDVTATHYYDDLGNIAKVQVAVISVNSSNCVTGSSPAVLDPCLVSFDASSGIYTTAPENLLNVEDFIAAFEPSWAESLLKYHPEFSFYRSCLTLTRKAGADNFSSESFDNKMSSTDEWIDAVNAGFVIPSSGGTYVNGNYGNTASAVWDPFVVYNPKGAELLYRVQNYQLMPVGGYYSMMEVAAMMTRCGGLPGSGPMGHNDDCVQFGSGTDLIIKKREWMTFKSLYYALKQELFLKYATEVSVSGLGLDPSYYGFNGCIGESDFDKNEYGFLTYQPFPSAFNNSQYFKSLQPCSQNLHLYYADKERRFISSTEAVPNVDAGEVAYQNYAVTGQCPLSNGLEALLSDAIQNNRLTAPSVTVHQTAGFSAFWQVYSNFEVSSAIPPTTWSATSTADQIDINVTNSVGLLGSITLQKSLSETVAYTWNDLLYLQNLRYTVTESGRFYFTAEGLVTGDEEGETIPVELRGFTSFNLANCPFADVCSPSQVGKDLEQLVKTLAGVGKLFSNPGYAVKASGAPLAGFVTGALTEAAGGNPAGDYNWTYDAGNSSFALMPSVGTTALSLHITASNPSGYSAAAVTAVKAFRLNSGNVIELDLVNAAGNAVTTLTCEIQTLESGSYTAFNIGNCEPPTPSYCEGIAYSNKKELEEAILYMLINQDQPNLQFFDNPNLSDAFLSQFPTGVFTTSYLEPFEQGGRLTLTPTVTEAGSPKAVSCPITIETNSPNSLDDLRELSDIQLTGEADINGDFHSFTATGLFLNDNVGDITITTCLPLLECKTCNAGTCDPFLSYAEAEEQFGNYPQGDRGDIFFCYTAFTDLNPYIDQFNGSDWADQNNAHLDIIPTIDALEWAYSGICGDCSANYLQQLQLYIAADRYANLPPLPPITEYTGCQTTVETSSECMAAYSQYFDCLVTASNLKLQTYIFTLDEFVSRGLCECVDGYCSLIQQLDDEYGSGPDSFTAFSADGEEEPWDPAPMFPVAQDTLETEPAMAASVFSLDSYGPIQPFLIDLQTYCEGPCNPENPQGTETLCHVLSGNVLPQAVFEDPCKEQIINTALTNAQNAYDSYIQGISGDFVERYTDHCLSAVESLRRTYADKEYHFTLYYYDQAGNLVKTVPPAGVEVLPITNDTDPLALAIRNDRALGTHNVVTSHRLASTYRYNSLNQLTAQAVPDQDRMDIWEITLPNGLVSNLNTTAIQMVSANEGYLSGYVTNAALPLGSRGYLYHTVNAGQNWTKVDYLVDVQLNKVEMITDQVGFAVGANGLILRTTNGGNDWDLLNTYSVGVTGTFNDLSFSSATSGRFVGANGVVLLYTAAGNTITLTLKTLTLPAGSTISTIKSVQSITGSYLYAVTVTDAAGIYDAIVRETTSIPLNPALNVIIESITGTRLRTVHYYSSTEGYAGGDNGNLVKLYTPATGTGFRQQMAVSNLTGTIEQLWFMNVNRGIALVNNSTSRLWYTTNAGESWAEVNPSGNLQSAITTIKLIQQSSNVLDLVAHTVNGDAVTIEWNDVTTQPYYHQRGAAGQVAAAASYRSGVTTWYYKASTLGTVMVSDPTNSTSNINYSTSVTLQNLTADESVRKIEAWQFTTGQAYMAVLSSTGRIHQLFRDASGTWSNGAVIAPLGANFVNFVLNTSNPAQPFLVAINNAGGFTTTLYRISFSSAGAATAATPVGNNALAMIGTFDAVGMGLNNNRLTVTGPSGQLHTSDAVTSATGVLPGVSWYDRSTLRFTGINDIHPSTVSGITHLAAGTNGQVIKRVNQAWQLLPLTETATFNAIANSGTNALLAGENGRLINLNAATNAITALATSSATTANLTGIVAADNGNVYVAGEELGSGVMLYASAYNATYQVTATPSGVYRAVSVIPNQTGVRPAIFVGAASHAARYTATNGTAIKQVHPPRLNDVHFAPGSPQYGTVAGEHFFVRTTSDASANWNVVMPASGTSLTTGLNRVWTQPNGSDHFAIIGGVSYLAKAVGNTATVIPLTGSGTPVALGTVRSIEFPRVGLSGYIADNTGIRTISLLASGTGYTVTVPVTRAANSAQTIRALHVFDNGTVMAVGTGNFVGYYSGTGNFVNMAAGATGTFNDVYFHDYRNGYIVGDNGRIYRTTSTTINPLNSNLQAVSWALKPVVDPFTSPIVTAATQCNIAAIAFSTATNGIWGGSYNGINSVTSYVRLLRDETNKYSSRFYYDKLGRIVVSQNSRQLLQNRYSYTLYDALGRVTEAGEKKENTPGTGVLQFRDIFGTNVNGQMTASVDDFKLDNWIKTQSVTTRFEVTRSYYDVTNVDIAGTMTTAGFTPNSLTQRKRIVHVTYEEQFDDNHATFDHATHYDYDIHGNVKTLIQDNNKMAAVTDIAANRFKRLDYNYDLISGNVHRVDYQNGKIDQWHHAYTYDADNRITAAFTTITTPITKPSESGQTASQNEPGLTTYWDKEAQYSYYDHGPLARVELGDEQVQGMDYVYTLQGWIKGVNSNTLNEQRDPGKDGYNGLNADNYHVARDVMGFSLHYYTDDYKAIVNGNNGFAATQTGSDLTTNSSDLFNGNIGRMVTTITDPNTRAVLPLGNAYRYDQLNRLSESVSYDNLNASTNTWGSGGAGKYQNSFTYDANGNIVTQRRSDETGQEFDNLIYRYNNNSAGNPVQNRLYHVNERFPNALQAALRDDDIDDQGTFTATDINVTSNYVYDAEGRLITDKQEKIDLITWRVDGKVKSVKQSGTNPDFSVSFDYDAMGHRIAKHAYDKTGSANGGLGNLVKSTYYVLDAQGNTMSVYEREVNPMIQSVSYKQKEEHIYGSSRLGVKNSDVTMPLNALVPNYSMASVTHRIGNKGYELNNHLGNVLSVISDKPLPHVNGTNVDYFMADIRQSTDYSPFGVELYGRNLTKNDPVTGQPIKDGRFGFQGQEEDDELKGEGNSLNFEFRMHDPRLGRFFAIDPLSPKYPHYTPYSFSGNKVTYCIEMEGLEEVIAIQRGDVFILIWDITARGRRDNNVYGGADQSGTILYIMEDPTIRQFVRAMTKSEREMAWVSKRLATSKNSDGYNHDPDPNNSNVGRPMTYWVDPATDNLQGETIAKVSDGLVPPQPPTPPAPEPTPTVDPTPKPAAKKVPSKAVLGDISESLSGGSIVGTTPTSGPTSKVWDINTDMSYGTMGYILSPYKDKYDLSKVKVSVDIIIGQADPNTIAYKDQGYGYRNKIKKELVKAGFSAKNISFNPIKVDKKLFMPYITFKLN